MNVRSLVVAATAAVAASAALADPITFEGELIANVPTVGAAPLRAAETGFDSDTSRWHWFHFTANAGDSVTVTALRLSGDMDPTFVVWAAGASLPTDTAPMGSIWSTLWDGTDSPPGLTHIGAADDNLPPSLPGPFGDASLTFNAPTSGYYVVLIVNNGSSSGSAGPSGPGLYSLTTTVPTPAAAGLFGLGALAATRRRR